MRKGEAGVGATAGVVQSISMHVMVTAGGKRFNAEKLIKAKRSSGDSAAVIDNEQIEEQVSKWDVTSFSLRPMKSSGVSSDAFGCPPKKEQALLEKMDLAKAERNAKARQEEIAKFKNRCLTCCEFAAILVIASPSALDALAAKHKDSPKELAEALHDQTRLRIHVYGMKRADLLRIGIKPGTTDQEEATRLLDKYRFLVKSLLPRKPPAPAPHPRCGCCALSTYCMAVSGA
jgi:hypothetical protein